MISACGQQFTLAIDTPDGQLSAVIAQVGASIRSLKLGDTEFILSCEPDEIAPLCAGIVMAPWPNRLDGGRWNYEGQTLRVPITIHDQQNANHGLLEFAEYHLVELNQASDRASVTLAATIYPRLGYPFLVETAVTYALSADGLTVTHEAKNLSAKAAPYGVGGHPYFQISGTPTEALELTCPAQSYLEVNERQIPVGKAPVEASRFDLRSGARVDASFLDHGFTDLARDADGLARTYLRSSNGGEIEVWQDASFKHVVIFTPDFYPTKNGSIYAAAIEPQTMGANGFNTGDDLLWLEQNQEFRASWGVRLTEPQR
jgi:aldose 1-epimerase